MPQCTHSTSYWATTTTTPKGSLASAKSHRTRTCNPPEMLAGRSSPHTSSPCSLIIVSSAHSHCMYELECMYAPCIMRARAEGSHPCIQSHCSPVRSVVCTARIRTIPVVTRHTALFHTSISWPVHGPRLLSLDMQHNILSASSCVNP